MVYSLLQPSILLLLLAFVSAAPTETSVADDDEGRYYPWTRNNWDWMNRTEKYQNVADLIENEELVYGRRVSYVELKFWRFNFTVEGAFQPSVLKICIKHAINVTLPRGNDGECCTFDLLEGDIYNTVATFKITRPAYNHMVAFTFELHDYQNTQLTGTEYQDLGHIYSDQPMDRMAYKFKFGNDEHGQIDFMYSMRCQSKASGLLCLQYDRFVPPPPVRKEADWVYLDEHGNAISTTTETHPLLNQPGIKIQS